MDTLTPMVSKINYRRHVDHFSRNRPLRILGLPPLHTRRPGRGHQSIHHLAPLSSPQTHLAQCRRLNSTSSDTRNSDRYHALAVVQLEHGRRFESKRSISLQGNDLAPTKRARLFKFKLTGTCASQNLSRNSDYE